MLDKDKFTTRSGRVHVKRDDDAPEEERYTVECIAHDGPNTEFKAKTLNVNGATFATDYCEFGAGGDYRVYKDRNIDGLVRIIVSPGNL